MGVIIHDILSTIIETESVKKSTELTLKKLAKDYSYEDIMEASGIVNDWVLSDDRFKYEVIGAEYKLVFSIREYDIIGYIDRLDKIDEHNYRIVDYKTGYQYNNIERSLQLDLYSYGIFKLFPEVDNIEVVYENIAYGTTASTVIERDKMEEIEDYIYAYLITMENDTDMEARISYDCSWCDFNSICPDFKKWLNIDKNKDIIEEFLSYRLKSKYYSDKLEEVKEILKSTYPEPVEFEKNGSIVTVSGDRIYVRKS